MKVRRGFVSNSSSTSFTCDLCGHTESGWDSGGIEEFGFQRCPNDHVICDDECLKLDKSMTEAMRAEMAANSEWMEWCKDEDPDFDPTTLDEDEIEDVYRTFHMEFDDTGATIPKMRCPICTFDIIADSELGAYLKKEHGTKEKDVLNFIKGGNKRRKRIYIGEYISYALNENKLQRKKVEADIRKKFKDFDEFQKYLGKTFVNCQVNE